MREVATEGNHEWTRMDTKCLPQKDAKDTKDGWDGGVKREAWSVGRETGCGMAQKKVCDSSGERMEVA